jgi:alpha-D-ribose 1-methylphosphonate 5-triphosphate synthase subunit PhnH
MATTTTMTLALTPSASQLVFRAVLDALARPGTAHRLPDVPHAPAALLPVLALADLGTPVCVLGDGDWEHSVRVTTSAPPSALTGARLVAALRPVSIAELAEIRVGTAAAPEDGALVCLAVEDLGTGQLFRVQGPGVRGVGELRLAGLPAGFAECRRQLVSGYPAGIDLLLVTGDGRVAGVPRTTVMEAA